MFLADDPLGDRLEMFKLDLDGQGRGAAAGGVVCRRRGCGRCPSIRPSSATARRRRRRPPTCCLDRPVPESAEGLSLETMPRLLGQALLFGRQTDREARLEVMGVAADEVSAVMALVREVAGEALAPAGQAGSRRPLVGQPETAPRRLAAAARRFARATPRHDRRARARRDPRPLAGAEAGRARRPLAARSGRRRRSCRVRVLAAIMVLEHWTERLPGAIDFNELRSSWACPCSARSIRGSSRVDAIAAGAAWAARAGRAFRRGSDVGLLSCRARSPFGRPCGSSPRRSSTGPVWPTATSDSTPMPRWPEPRRTSNGRWSTSSKGRRATEAKKQSGRIVGLDGTVVPLCPARRPGSDAADRALPAASPRRAGRGRGADADADRRGPAASRRHAGHRSADGRGGGGRRKSRRPSPANSGRPTAPSPAAAAESSGRRGSSRMSQGT